MEIANSALHVSLTSGIRSYNLLVAGDVSKLIARWCYGDYAALSELTPIVYDELRRLANSYLVYRSGDALLQPTVLVHEAWIKLADKSNLSIHNRAQFYGLAAKIMRDLLIDHARRQGAVKRGGPQILLPLDEEIKADNPDVDFLNLNDAINRLAAIKPRYSELVELKFFAGLSIEEIATALNVSRATVEREWTFARLWLRRELAV